MSAQDLDALEELLEGADLGYEANWKAARILEDVPSLVAELRASRTRIEWLEGECDLWKLRAIKAESELRAARAVAELARQEVVFDEPLFHALADYDRLRKI